MIEMLPTPPPGKSLQSALFLQGVTSRENWCSDQGRQRLTPGKGATVLDTEALGRALGGGKVVGIGAMVTRANLKTPGQWTDRSEGVSAVLPSTTSRLFWTLRMRPRDIILSFSLCLFKVPHGCLANSH